MTQYTQIHVLICDWKKFHKIHIYPYYSYCSYFFLMFICFLISHPFYTHQGIHVNPNRPIQHTTTPTPCRFPPLVSIRLFSTSVPLFLPCKQVHLYHFSRFHIYVLIYDICFSLSDLTSLYTTVSRSIYVSTNNPISFLFMTE